jgi:GT2 family glycosyltransferase
MRISAVILNWNRPDDTVQAVNSVLTQTYGDFEVLVWDNASSDHSREMLTRAFGSDSRVRLLWGDSNYGVAGGRNRAFAQAQGDILLSLDSDAIMVTPHDFQRMADVMTAEPDIGAISFEVCRPDGHLMWPFARPASSWRTRRFDTIRVDGCSFATRRHVFTQIGGFAEHFSPYGAEDQYYAYQVIGAGLRVVYFPEIRVLHSFTPKGRQGRQFAMHVRNMIWMPMELFPFPHHLVRATAQAYYLWREASEVGQQASFREGLLDAYRGYSHKRRRPMPGSSWHTLRRLIADDKRAALEVSPTAAVSGNVRP